MPRVTKTPNPHYVLTANSLPRMGISTRCYIARRGLEEIGTLYTTNLADARRWGCSTTTRSYRRSRPERTKGFRMLNLQTHGFLVTA